jgi:hypothetical protein
MPLISALLKSSRLPLAFAFAGLTALAPSVAAAATYYVSTTGVDTNPGTLASPFRTIYKGLGVLVAGDTLQVRGGTYVENIARTPNKGTSASPVTVINYPGERPVVQGKLWLTSADYWVIDGINVTWSTTNTSDVHMVKFSGGQGWKLKNAELWGARSFAALLVTGGASGWYVGYNTIHDTYASNSTNQDHLIYVSNGLNGTLERNVLYNSTNGRAIKVGPPSSGSSAPSGITIRYNTMYNNLGPSNVQLSYGTANCSVYRNIMQKAGGTNRNVTQYNMTGTGNVAYDNVGYESSGVVESDPTYLKDTGGNLYRNPQFNNASVYDFHPLDVTSQAYGRYAP